MCRTNSARLLCTRSRERVAVLLKSLVRRRQPLPPFTTLFCPEVVADIVGFVVLRPDLSPDTYSDALRVCIEGSLCYDLLRETNLFDTVTSDDNDFYIACNLLIRSAIGDLFRVAREQDAYAYHRSTSLSKAHWEWCGTIRELVHPSNRGLLLDWVDRHLFGFAIDHPSSPVGRILSCSRSSRCADG